MAYNFIPYYTHKMREDLKKYHNNKDIMLFIFTEGGQKQSIISEWHTLFKDMGSKYFNFPEEPYIGIIQFSDECMQLLEWS